MKRKRKHNKQTNKQTNKKTEIEKQREREKVRVRARERERERERERGEEPKSKIKQYKNMQTYRYTFSHEDELVKNKPNGCPLEIRPPEGFTTLKQKERKQNQ